MNNPDMDNLWQMSNVFSLDNILLLLLSLAGLVLVVKALEKLGEIIYKKLPSRRMLISQVVTVSNFMIYVFGSSFLVYAILRPPKELMFAITGSAAVAIGLSLKDLVASVIAGFILLFDRPFQVGDRVTFGDVYGEISSIGLRAVRLITLDDNLVTIPNNRFMTDVVASGNAGELDMMLLFDFHLALDADLTLARDLLYEIVVTSRFAYLNKPVTVVLAEVVVAEVLAMQLRAKAYVIDVRFEKAFQTDVYLRTTEAFRKQAIRRPVFKYESGHG